MWAVDPNLIQITVQLPFFFFFEVGEVGYWMLSDLWHYCYFLGIDKIIVLGLYFKKSPYLLVIDTDVVKGEIMFGICFKLIQSRVGEGKKKLDRKLVCEVSYF